MKYLDNQQKIITDNIPEFQIEYKMKPSGVLSNVVLFMLVVLISSCDAVVGIFNAGMSVGGFIVIAIVVLIAIFVMRAGRNKKS